MTQDMEPVVILEKDPNNREDNREFLVIGTRGVWHIKTNGPRKLYMIKAYSGDDTIAHQEVAKWISVGYKVFQTCVASFGISSRARVKRSFCDDGDLTLHFC